MVSIFQSALFVAFFLVLASSVLITSLFKFRNIIPYLLSIYLLSFANIVFAGEIASLVNLLNNRFFFLFIHIVLIVISFIVWKGKGSPPLFPPIIHFYKTIKSIDPIQTIKKHPFLILLILSVIVTYIVGFILVLKVAPNNYDALTGHIARVGYWLQHGNFKPWPTWFTVQTEYPINAQIQVLWSILFWRTDTFAGFTQWIASIVSIVAIYGISRQINRSRSQSLFASFICALFPIIILESTTVQPHLCGAALSISSFYFLFKGFREDSKTSFVLAGLAFAMALGVHYIFIFMIPSYGLTIIFLTLLKKSNRWTFFKLIIGSIIGSFFVFSAYIYIQNSIYTHYPFGNYMKGTSWSPENSLGSNQKENYWLPKNFTKYTFFNLEKYLFATYDLTGLPDSVVEPLYKLRDYIFIPLFEISNNPLQHKEFDINVRVPAVSENWAWFGMVGFVLFCPLMIIEFFSGIKQKEPIRLLLVINIILYTLIWAGIISREDYWHMYSSRYFIPAGLLFAPLIAITYKNSWVSKIFVSLLVVFSICIAFYTMRDNYAKPLFSSGVILKWTRLEQIYRVSWDQYSLIETVNEIVPKETNLGLLFFPNTIEYPYFGEYLKRTLVPIFPYENILDDQWLTQNKVEWILDCVNLSSKPNYFIKVKDIPLDSPVVESTGCVLYQRTQDQ
ncbi:MAG: hypothetical protein C0412_12125 [Flavobacterium sp.]|nr:hypothetical protein [Flavobacterium sp.]